MVVVLIMSMLPALLARSASAVVSPPGCPDVLVIGARGSGEPENNHGLGEAVGTLYDTLEADLKNKLLIKRLLVVYPAANVDVLRRLTKSEQALLAAALTGAPGALTSFLAIYKINHLDPFLASIDEGITSALDELRTEAAQCKRTRFVLAGYSQGAMVMHQTLLRLDDRGETGLLNRIAATVLIADGDKKKETAATRFGTSSFEAEGVRSFATIGERDVPSSKASTTYDICNDGDLVCDFHLSSLMSKAAEKVHTGTYKKSTLVRNVGHRIAGDLLGGTLPVPQEQWTQDGYGADRAGVNPTEATINTANVTTLRSTWRYTDPTATRFSRPVTTGKSTFMVATGTSSSRLIAVDFVTGTLQWQQPISGTARQGPILSGSLVVVQSSSGLFAFSATDGSPRWNNSALPTTLCAAGNMAAAADGTTIYAFSGSAVTAVDAATGLTRWATAAPVFCFSGLAVAAGRVFAVSRSVPDPPTAQRGQLRALDASTGGVLWTTTTTVAMDGEPAAGAGLVFVGTQYETQGLVAFDQATGNVRWHRTDVLAFVQAPAVTASALIVTSASGAVLPPTIRALNPTTGALIWSRTVPNAIAGGDPVIANGLVYFGSRGDPKAVYAARLDTGALAATLQLGTGAGTHEINPIVVNGTVLATVTPDVGFGTPTVPTLQAFRLP